MGLLFLSLFWICGIYLGEEGLHGEVLTLIVSVLILASLFYLWKAHRRLLIIFSLVLLSLGLLRSALPTPALPAPAISEYNGKKVELQGMILEADKGGRFSSILLKVEGARIDEDWERVEGNIMIYSFNFPLPKIGDEVRVYGKLTEPEPDYLKRRGIHSVTFYPELRILGNKGSPVKRFIFNVRENLNDSLITSLPEPQCSLSQALTLGIRTHVPYSLKEEFRTTGTYHLMAISGLHLSIICGTLLSLLAFLLGRDRPTYLILTFILIWFYALISGMRPPIMRASIMASMVLLAYHLGRPAGGLGLLSLAAAVMVGVEPELLWDVSFLLSFSAMVGIITLSPYFQRGGEKLVKSAVKEEGLSLSIANQANVSLALSLGSILATFPLIAYYFDIVSPISPVATLLALPAILPIVLTSFGVGITGIFSPFLSQVMGWLAFPFLSYLMVVVKGFSLLPFSSFEVEVGRQNIILAYYVMLFGGMLFWRRLKKP